MKKNLICLYSVIVAVGIVVGLLGGPISGAYAAGTNRGIIPTYAKPYGMTYGEWSAKYWQWLYAMPVDQHPLFDTADCSEGQTGKVWFLGGTFTAVGDNVVIGEANRSCDIPAGTALFFPILNGECNEILDASTDEDVLRACANHLADHITDLKVTIDGREVQHLDLYRADSPLFTVGPLPVNNVIGASAGTTFSSVADGYYIMLAPLSRGTHDIYFEGAAVFTLAEDGFDFRYELYIDYQITVQ